MPMQEFETHVYEIPAGQVCKKLGMEGHLASANSICVQPVAYVGKKSGKTRRGFKLTFTTLSKIGA